MRLNKFTLAILFSVCSIHGFSQEQHPVKGKIENAKNEDGWYGCDSDL